MNINTKSVSKGNSAFVMGGKITDFIPSCLSKTSNCIATSSFKKRTPLKRKAVFENEVSSSSKRTPPISTSSKTIADFTWKKITHENLSLQYAHIFSKQYADELFQRLEDEIEYFSGDLARVVIYGKSCAIPRKQVSYGEEGLTYKFSGTCIPAIPWEECPIIKDIKLHVEAATGYKFNFVLVNRYKDGWDHIGEHRDDEKDLVADAPIASLSLGQCRDFVFRHKDARGKNAARRDMTLTLELKHGSLLVMKCPTNKYWYHSLPVRKKALGVRINLTFRQMVRK